MTRRKQSRPTRQRSDNGLVNALSSAVARHRGGDIDGAMQEYRRILKSFPDHPEVKHMLGVAYLQQEEWNAAIGYIEEAIRVAPGQASFYVNLGSALKGAGRLGEALESYKLAMTLETASADVNYNCGNLYQALGQIDQAVESYTDAVTKRPVYADAYNNRGLIYKSRRQYDEALEDFNCVIRLRPDLAPGYVNKGNVLQDLELFEEAIDCFNKALAIDPENADAIYNKGNALKFLGRFVEALQCYTEAIKLQADMKDAYQNLGSVLQDLNQLEQALACYDLAAALFPQAADIHANRGRVFYRIGRIGDAIASLELAVKLNPDSPETFFSLGAGFKDIGKYRDAARCFGEALQLNPQMPYARGELLTSLSHICDWQGRERLISEIADGVRAGLPQATPFSLISAIDDPHLQHINASIFAKREFKARGGRGPNFRALPSSEKKIRIAYLSADFHDHATCHLMAECFELHDKEKFELIAISFGPETGDAMRARIRAAFDRFIDVREMTDDQVVELCRSLKVHIAIDLKGYTKDCRTRIFVERCAPIQINWLGYPGTMGGCFMDYIIADPQIISEEDLRYYSEKVIWMPNSYQVNDRKRAISDRNYVRSELGIPEDAFVYCCFNSAYKITPSVFKSWLRILEAVPNSVMWLLEDSAEAVNNLKSAARDSGIDVARLVFAKRLPPAENLARLALADLVLDTWPCNAHTTASDALWAGIPVLTLKGRSFPARVASSLVCALEMSEMVTYTEDEYIDLAILIAKDHDFRGKLAVKLQRCRLSTALFDSREFAKGLAWVFEHLFEQQKASLPAKHITVPRALPEN